MTQYPSTDKIIPGLYFEYIPTVRDSFGNIITSPPPGTIEIHSPVSQQNGVVRGIADNTIEGYLEGSEKLIDNGDGIYSPQSFQNIGIDTSGNNYSEMNGNNYSDPNGYATDEDTWITNPNNYTTHPIPWMLWDGTKLYGWPQEIDQNQNFTV